MWAPSGSKQTMVMIFGAILFAVASVVSTMAQAEGGGISFDSREVGSDWTQLLSGTGLLIALGGGVVFFVLRSWVWPKLKPWLLVPAFSHLWPSIILALGLVTAVLESRRSLNTTAENLLV